MKSLLEFIREELIKEYRIASNAYITVLLDKHGDERMIERNVGEGAIRRTVRAALKKVSMRIQDSTFKDKSEFVIRCKEYDLNMPCILKELKNAEKFILPNGKQTSKYELHVKTVMQKGNFKVKPHDYVLDIYSNDLHEGYEEIEVSDESI